MYESLGFTALTAPQAAVAFALLLGLVFGALAERTRFCLRRALVGNDRREAAGVWAVALAVAVAGTQVAIAAGWIAFDTHRLMATDLPILAILLGGAVFGAGMVLTRGCASRLTVLAGTGNMRAWLALLVFAVTAHAMLKGVLAPVRTALGSVTLPVGDAASLAALPGGAAVWAALAILAAAALAVATRIRPGLALEGAAIGALVPLAWVGTGLVLYDDFDPIAMQGLSFTAPWADSLFWTVAASAIPAGFGVGLVGGVIAGGLLSAAAARRLAWQGFEGPAQTGRFMAGAVLMGAGGVLAGGCTVGAGLAGIPTLSVAALLAFAAIMAGALVTHALINGTAARGASVPAE